MGSSAYLCAVLYDTLFLLNLKTKRIQCIKGLLLNEIKFFLLFISDSYAKT